MIKINQFSFFTLFLILIAIFIANTANAAVDYSRQQKLDQQQITINYDIQPGLKSQDYFFLNGAEQGTFKLIGATKDQVTLTILTPELREINNVDLDKIFSFPGYGKYSFIIQYKQPQNVERRVSLQINFTPLELKK